MTDPPQRPDALTAAELKAEAELFEELYAASRHDAPPRGLVDDIVRHAQYRERLEQHASSLWRRQKLWLVLGAAGLSAAAALALLTRGASDGAEIHPEARPGSAQITPGPRVAPPDPCREPVRAAGSQPLIDDFEDGDDALAPLEQRAGFWRWAREIDAPGTAPALIPTALSGASGSNRQAVHVSGARLFDWGAAVEVTFRPPCYDASKYGGMAFDAKGPGRIYAAPREVSDIPVADGGTCESDCHNPHVVKVDLTPELRPYEVRWSDVRQRGRTQRPLDPTRLNSIAFLIRPEDTPYDVWIDNVRFLPR